MDAERLTRWLADYVEAWKSYDRELIAALFSERASYRYHPADEPIVGVEAIVDSWLDEPDAPESWEAHYEPYAIEGDRAVATGTSTYFDKAGALRAVYDNCFTLRFDPDGRCREFREHFMLWPGAGDA